MKKELILRILKKLDRESELLSEEELGLNREQFVEILEIMKNDNLISDIDIRIQESSNKPEIFFSRDVKITVNGIEYLEKNNDYIKLLRKTSDNFDEDILDILNEKMSMYFKLVDAYNVLNEFGIKLSIEETRAIINSLVRDSFIYCERTETFDLYTNPNCKLPAKEQDDSYFYV